MTLTLRGFIDLPPHARGGFDHGDVELSTGRVFVAHAANGTVEVIDGLPSRHLSTIAGCPEASGVSDHEGGQAPGLPHDRQEPGACQARRGTSRQHQQQRRALSPAQERTTVWTSSVTLSGLMHICCTGDFP